MGLEERPKQKPVGQREGCQETLVLPRWPLPVPWQDREGLRQEGESPGSEDKLQPREVRHEQAGEQRLPPGEMPQGEGKRAAGEQPGLPQGPGKEQGLPRLPQGQGEGPGLQLPWGSEGRQRGQLSQERRELWGENQGSPQGRGRPLSLRQEQQPEQETLGPGLLETLG